MNLRLSFKDAFNLLVRDGEPVVGAGYSMAHLSEDFDLTDPAYKNDVATIASWIESPNDEIRREVVVALCFGRNVPGYETLAIKGWRRADDGTLHWYASAIEFSFTKPEQIHLGVVLPIVAKLWREIPKRDAFSSELDYTEAVDERNMCISQTMRVLRHLDDVVHHRELPQRYDYSKPELEIDWQLAARFLYKVGLASQVPSDDPDPPLSEPS